MFPQVLFHLTVSSKRRALDGNRFAWLVYTPARTHASQEGAHVDDRMHVFQMSYDFSFFPNDSSCDFIMK